MKAKIKATSEIMEVFPKRFDKVIWEMIYSPFHSVGTEYKESDLIILTPPQQ